MLQISEAIELMRCLMSLQGGEASFSVDMALNGDVVIALWRGDQMRPWDKPTWSYAFHTAFVHPGVLRVTADNLDFQESTAIADGLAVDLMLEEDNAPLDNPSRCCPG